MWSRSARRKQQREQIDKMDTDGDDSEEDDEYDGENAAMAVKISVKADAVHIHWLRGAEYTLVESFSGMLMKKLKAELGSRGNSDK